MAPALSRAFEFGSDQRKTRSSCQLARELRRHIFQPRTTHVVLATLDGVRVQEMFGGLDAEVLRAGLGKDARSRTTPPAGVTRAPASEARRERLMPFFRANHGCGDTPHDSFDHGEIEGAQNLCLAIASPDDTRRGAWSGGPMRQDQVAATIAAAFGID